MFKAHRRLYYSTPGSRVTKKKQKKDLRTAGRQRVINTLDSVHTARKGNKECTQHTKRDAAVCIIHEKGQDSVHNTLESIHNTRAGARGQL